MHPIRWTTDLLTTSMFAQRHKETELKSRTIQRVARDLPAALQVLGVSVTVPASKYPDNLAVIRGRFNIPLPADGLVPGGDGAGIVGAVGLKSEPGRLGATLFCPYCLKRPD
jgi:hypothetical protein